MSPSIVPATPITTHAQTRMDSRRISASAVDVIIAYGRSVRARGAHIYALGKKEIKQASKDGLDLRSYSGLQVICSSSGTVLTAYRNHDFSSLRRSA